MKMTDNEIIKALECCTNNNALDNCDTCPLCDYGNCQDTLIKYCSNTINRQKVEIARLKTQLSKSKEFHTFTLDREQLVAIVESQFEKFEVDAATVRNDAIREFATKLKQQVDFVYRPGGYHVLFDAIEVINALVKEMTEGQDNG